MAEVDADEAVLRSLVKSGVFKPIKITKKGKTKTVYYPTGKKIGRVVKPIRPELVRKYVTVPTTSKQMKPQIPRRPSIERFLRPSVTPTMPSVSPTVTVVKPVVVRQPPTQSPVERVVSPPVEVPVERIVSPQVEVVPPTEVPVEQVTKPKVYRRPVTEEIEEEQPEFPLESPAVRAIKEEMKKRKLRKAFNYSPEDFLSRENIISPSYSFDYSFSPEDFFARRRKFAPRLFYDFDYSPEDFYSDTDIFSPSESYDNTFAPKYRDLKRSVYSPSKLIKTKFTPKISRKIAFKPRLFDKLLSIFAPEAIIKQKEALDFQPYNYQYTQTAIIDAYNPEQITSIEKYAPKNEENFNLRIAPETDFTIKLSPTPPMFSTSIYFDILKKVLR